MVPEKKTYTSWWIQLNKFDIVKTIIISLYMVENFVKFNLTNLMLHVNKNRGSNNHMSGSSL